MDTATIAVTADEFYSFPGDPNAGRPTYWVARHDRTVTSQSGDRDRTVDEYDTVEEARAGFAEETCDPTGPGAPQVGDSVYILDLDRMITVTDVEAHDGCRPGWVLNKASDNIVVAFWRYRISSRPAVTS